MQKIIYVKQTASNCLFKKGFYVVGEENGSGWKKFLRKHWNIVAIFVAAGVLGFAGAIYVYLWFVGDAQATGLVPSILGLWTMGHLVWFILHAVFWELLFIGIPAIIGAVAGWQWWKRLSDEEKKEYRFLANAHAQHEEAAECLHFSLLRSPSKFMLTETGTLLLKLGH
jgi:hypothetical protein